MINTQRLVKNFIRMVTISSESGNESEFAHYMLRLGNFMGLKTRSDKFGNIYLYLQGEGEPLMLNTHMDTVSPGVGIRAKVSGKYIVSGGDTILGADSKAGIAAMIEAIQSVQEKNIRHRPVLITLTCNEESGIPTADKIISDIKICVVPDRGAPVGEIITESPFDQVFEVVVSGKTAYAPSNYNDGRHAIMAINNIINSVPWGNIDKFTTTNIGLINGGLMTTMIPEMCSFKANCYSFRLKSVSSFLRKVSDAAKKTDAKFGTTTKVNLLEYFGGYKLKRTDPLVKTVEAAIEGSKIDPVFKVYKTVTNANLLNQIGIKTVLIGTGVENQHTVRERISVTSLERLTNIVINIISGGA